MTVPWRAAGGLAGGAPLDAYGLSLCAASAARVAHTNSPQRWIRPTPWSCRRLSWTATGLPISRATSSTDHGRFIDLKPGYKLKKIYGDANHALKISSSANFYNNIDRPSAYFGYLINKSWFPSNPTIALDSWLTLGLATKTQ